MEQTKVCKGCGKVLPLSSFGYHAKSSDGHLALCKDCRRRQNDKTDAVNPLEKFTGRELMDELFKRGYRGELSYTEVHKIILGK